MLACVNKWVTPKPLFIQVVILYQTYAGSSPVEDDESVDASRSRATSNRGFHEGFHRWQSGASQQRPAIPRRVHQNPVGGGKQEAVEGRRQSAGEGSADLRIMQGK